MKFEQIITKVLSHEGGYVNNPSDRGGETKYGISKRMYPDLDIKNLTVQKAVEIYRHDYWKPSRAEMLPIALRDNYFDMVVNHGQGNAVRILQRAINMIEGKSISVDGSIGPITIREAKNVDRFYVILQRIRFFNAIVGRDNSQSVFLQGWLNRAISFC